MKSKISIFLFLIITSISLAQTKVGTINSDYIINLMPEGATVVKLSEAYGIRLDSSFNIKVEEYKLKAADFKEKEEEMGPLMKKTVYNELVAMEKDIESYQKNGNQLMQLKQNELMRPLYKKLSEAIVAVAKEKGYTQILTTSGNEFAYLDENFDITKLVMDKLGIKEPEIKE